jgi:hypothetical protein
MRIRIHKTGIGTILLYLRHCRYHIVDKTLILSGIGSDEDSQLRELGRFLTGYSLHHAAPALLPRGLTNR